MNRLDQIDRIVGREDDLGGGRQPPAQHGVDGVAEAHLEVGLPVAVEGIAGAESVGDDLLDVVVREHLQPGAAQVFDVVDGRHTVGAVECGEFIKFMAIGHGRQRPAHSHPDHPLAPRPHAGLNADIGVDEVVIFRRIDLPLPHVEVNGVGAVGACGGGKSR